MENLYEEVIEQISQGKKNLIIWGFNDSCITLVSYLKESGLLNCLQGIVDHRTELQGQKIFDFTVQEPSEIASLEVDLLAITLDKEKEDVLRIFSQIDGRIPEVIINGTENYEFSDPVFTQIAKSCLTRSYANGYKNSLIHIYQSIKYLCENDIQGDVVEFGVFKGGTLVFIAKTLEYFGRKDVKVYGFDIFDETPKNTTVLDLYKHSKVEFQDYQAVISHCAQYGIEIIKGDICETYKFIQDKNLMFAFFDTDVYTPSKIALNASYGQIVKGGILAFDHVVANECFLSTLGERMAAVECLKDKKVFNLHGTGIYIKC
jgi:hypothetical protein